jgi:hypothetical protein
VDGLFVRRGIVSVLIHRDVYEISPVAMQHSRIVRRELRAEAIRHLAARVRFTLPGCNTKNPFASFDA